MISIASWWEGFPAMDDVFSGTFILRTRPGLASTLQLCREPQESQSLRSELRLDTRTLPKKTFWWALLIILY